MSVQFWIIVICIILIYNIYYDNKLYNKLKDIYKYKKYYKIGLIVIFGLGALKIIKKSPTVGYENMSTLNTLIQLMPIDRQSKDLITPFFKPQDNINEPYSSVKKLNNSGKRQHKRSVSETKKKYVASLQNWKCKHCKTQLSAWFEVDHKTRLDDGGNNEVSNLEALCRECHGKKTAMENL